MLFDLLDVEHIPEFTVPGWISVYISNPQFFFNLFDINNNKPAQSSSSMLLGNSNSMNVATRNCKNFSSKMTITEAAFALLQWAEYGNLPELPTFAVFSDSTAKAKEDSDSSGEESSEKNTGKYVVDEDLVLKEEDFAAEERSQADAESQKSGWATEVNNDNLKSSLPEMQDPRGFKHSLVLRPYQRQALYWMMKRELEGANREELEKGLMLLSELASNSYNEQNDSGASSSSSRQAAGLVEASTPDIQCDCSPVHVSEEARKKAKTLDGQKTPINHPLWKTRFLASSNLDRAYLFYVNELFGVASCLPPDPPKQCCGGILADDMYVEPVC